MGRKNKKAVESLESNLHTLHCLMYTNPRCRKTILATEGDDLIKCICDCCENILAGTVELSPDEKEILLKYKDQIRILGTPKRLGVKKQGMKKRRKILIQNGLGGFLPAILGPVLAVATGIITSLLKKD